MNVNGYQYHLVEFENEVLDPGQERIECVPTKWVEFDKYVGRHYCKRPPSSYSPEILKFMIKKQADPQADWKLYTVIIRESAPSYEEAIQCLRRLTPKEFVCTTECDKPQKEAMLTTKSLAENIIKQRIKVAKIIKVPTIKKQIYNLHSSKKSSEKKTTNYSLTLSEKETADTSRSCLSPQNLNPEIGSNQEASLLIEMKLSEEKCESESEPSCSFQSIKQSTESDAVRTTCTEEKKRASTSEEDKNVYRNDTPVVNDEMHDSRTLKQDVLQIKKTLNRMEKMLQVLIEREPRIDQRAPHIDQEAPPIDQRTPPFDEKYKLILPFDTYEKFNKFDTSIRENVEQRADFEQILSKELSLSKGNENLIPNIEAILKKIITPDVAKMFNAKSSATGRYIFKNTCFSDCLFDMIKDKASKNQDYVSDQKYFADLYKALKNFRKL